jgi:hypothetical protein
MILCEHFSDFYDQFLIFMHDARVVHHTLLSVTQFCAYAAWKVEFTCVRSDVKWRKTVKINLIP